MSQCKINEVEIKIDTNQIISKIDVDFTCNHQVYTTYLHQQTIHLLKSILFFTLNNNTCTYVRTDSLIEFGKMLTFVLGIENQLVFKFLQIDHRSTMFSSIRVMCWGRKGQIDCQFESSFNHIRNNST